MYFASTVALHFPDAYSIYFFFVSLVANYKYAYVVINLRNESVSFSQRNQVKRKLGSYLFLKKKQSNQEATSGLVNKFFSLYLFLTNKVEDFHTIQDSFCGNLTGRCGVLVTDVFLMSKRLKFERISIFFFINIGWYLSMKIEVSVLF